MDVLVNVIAVAVIALIVGGALTYIILAKKRGEKCVGCPYAKQCSGKCGGCNNSQNTNTKK